MKTLVSAVSISRCLAYALGVLGISIFRYANAFDPMTIAMGAQAVSGIMGGMDKADEVADIGFPLADLLSELGAEPEGEGAMRDAVTRLEGLNSKARELRWNKEDLKNALDYDLKKASSVADKLKALRNMIAASKRIAAVMGIRPKAGEKAAVIQEIRINSMILEELQAMRRAQFLAYLEDKEAKTQREIFMQEILEENTTARRGRQQDAKSLITGRRTLDNSNSEATRRGFTRSFGGGL